MAPARGSRARRGPSNASSIPSCVGATFPAISPRQQQARISCQRLMPFHNCGMFHVGACTAVHVCGRASCEKRLSEQLPDRQTDRAHYYATA